MPFSDDEVAELKHFFPDVQGAKEGGITYLLLQNAKLPQGCQPGSMDLLLCPNERDGYPSRLYFAQKLQQPASLNWNGNCRVLERNWCAFSWKVEPGLRLAQMIQAHLRALR